MHDTESPESLAWAELQRRGSIRDRYTRGLRDEISAELARCLDPFVHEQDIRPYGAMIARETRISIGSAASSRPTTCRPTSFAAWRTACTASCSS